MPIAATHTSQPSACEWNSLELLFCGISNTGDLLFEALLFVPAGTWEATAFIAASDAVSAPRAWVSSFGENALITSSWADVPCSVGLARSLPAFSSFQFEPVSSSPSSLLGPVPTPSIIRPRLSQMCAAPWVAARPGEARVCAVLTRACSLVHTLPEFRLSSEALSSNIACSYIAIMAAAILVEHLSGSVELHGVLSVALLITTVLRDHSTANKTRILTLCTGFTGEKIAVIMRGLDSHARSILACSSLPVLPAVTEVDPEHALLSLTHWAFDVVPSLVPAAGPSGSLLSQLALDLADVSIDSYKQLRVMPRVVDMLVHQLLLPANCSVCIGASVHVCMCVCLSTCRVCACVCVHAVPSVRAGAPCATV